MALPRMSKVWMDGELVDWDDATVHVLTPSLHTGFSLLEGMRAHPTERGPAIFQHRAHVERLLRSARTMGVEVPFSPDELMDGARRLCAANGQDRYYLRLIAYLGYGDMGLDPSAAPVRVAIAAWPWTAAPGGGDGTGVRVAISSWQRVSPAAVPAASTVAGAYVGASLARMEAVRAGYDDAIMLNEHGRVAEATTQNVFVVADGVLITPPTSEGVGAGITRDAVRDLARDADLTIAEAPLLRHDLYTADEAFLTGTAAEIVPIRSVDDRPIPCPGPVTKQVQEIFSGVVRGRDPKYDHMLDYVTG